ncbi:MAG: PAS domain S-box protein [Ignavibacteria bacterium]|nr:PAS domain S-box protein [Ignavibacteria bacterium]
MNERSDSKGNDYSIQEKLIGIGEHSFRKTYYPQLQQQLEYLEEKSAALLNMLEDLEEARRKLEESEERYRLIAENTADTIAVFDLNLNYTYVSPSVIKLLGYAPDEIIALRLEKIVSPNSWQMIQQTFMEEMEFEKSGKADPNRSRIFIIEQYCKDGTKIWVEGTTSFVRNKFGKPINILSISRDITERKQAEVELRKHRENLEELVQQRTEELKEANEELVRKEKLAVLGQLTAVVGHELRNPLGTIRNSIYEMNERLRGKNSGLEKALDRAERNIIRCDTIIEELLDYARETEDIMESLLIDEWIEDFLDETEIPEKIKLVRKLNAGVEININPESFRRCLINLIDNAVHAMTETEKEVKSKKQSPLSNVLSIETRIEEDNLIINIKDSGPGMSKDELKRIFEPLYSTKGFGVGLGLPIVKKIIQQHNGGIEITSKPGEGTVTVLRLPLIKNIKSDL